MEIAISQYGFGRDNRLQRVPKDRSLIEKPYENPILCSWVVRHDYVKLICFHLKK